MLQLITGFSQGQKVELSNFTKNYRLMMPTSKTFTDVPEIQRAEENFQNVILKLLNNEITFEEFEKSHKVLFSTCDQFGTSRNRKTS